MESQRTAAATVHTVEECVWRSCCCRRAPYQHITNTNKPSISEIFPDNPINRCVFYSVRYYLVFDDIVVCCFHSEIQFHLSRCVDWTPNREKFIRTIATSPTKTEYHTRKKKVPNQGTQGAQFSKNKIKYGRNQFRVVIVSFFFLTHLPWCLSLSVSFSFSLLFFLRVYVYVLNLFIWFISISISNFLALFSRCLWPNEIKWKKIYRDLHIYLRICAHPKTGI